MTLHPLLQSTLPATRDGLAVAADVAVVALGALAVVAVVAVAVLLVHLRRIGTQLSALTRELTSRVDPLLESSRGIAENVEFISASVRTDIEKVNRAVHAVSHGIEQASEQMESRLEEFNALMEVVQGEAETTFLDTASTMRGVKAGARRFSRDSEEDEPPR
ncbi:MAG: hypothetical protein RQ745_00880 [Longimicrobiales bacterium]|nr:hypothetical protein [Longimicrobiales bacterium]